MAITTADPRERIRAALAAQDARHAENTVNELSDDDLQAACKAAVDNARYLDLVSPRRGKPSRVAELQAECEAALREDDGDDDTTAAHARKDMQPESAIAQEVAKSVALATELNRVYAERERELTRGPGGVLRRGR